MKALETDERFGLVALAVFALLPAIVPGWQVSELAIYMTYGLFAVSLAFVWGHCGMLSLGQAVFFGTGAYLMSITTLGKLPMLSGLHSTWAGLVIATAGTALFAHLLGRFLFSASRLQGAFFGIIMLAVAFLAERLAINSAYLGGLNGLMNIPPINTGINGQGTEVWQAIPVYYISFFVLSVVLVLMAFVLRSPFGMAMKAIAGNEQRARALGYDTISYKVRAFTLGGAIAGLAGAMFVTQFNFASPSLIGFTLSAEVLIWVAVGGRGSLVTAALGAILVRWMESSFSSVLGDYWLIVLGAMFVITVMVFPRGLLGQPLYWLDTKLKTRAAKT